MNTHGDFKLKDIGGGLVAVKAIFELGAGQKEGLADVGLRKRLLQALGEEPLVHRMLQKQTVGQTSTDAELDEERNAVSNLLAGKALALPLDTTMTVVPLESGEVALVSLAPLTEELFTAVTELGEVHALVAPSLQHWTFLPEWAERLPQARVLVAPAALGEDLADKLPTELIARAEVLIDGSEQLPGLEGRLLRGAPLNLNEVCFYHKASETLVVSDAFYGGYKSTSTWFQRLWFKLTKGMKLDSSSLPVYRSERVHSHGSVAEAVACIDSMLDDWKFNKIVFAHGTVPLEHDCRNRFQNAWHSLKAGKVDSNVDHYVPSGVACCDGAHQ
jgi:hypothetical protein